MRLIFKTEDNKEKLYVCDEYVLDKNIKIYSSGSASYADLPFIAILEKLGFKIKWEGNNLAYINEYYILDLNRCYFTKIGDSDNWFDPLIGGPCTRKVLYKDILLDSWTIESIIEDMGKDIYIDFDFDKSIVYITDKKE